MKLPEARRRPGRRCFVLICYHPLLPNTIIWNSAATLAGSNQQLARHFISAEPESNLLVASQQEEIIRSKLLPLPSVHLLGPGQDLETESNQWHREMNDFSFYLARAILKTTNKYFPSILVGSGEGSHMPKSERISETFDHHL